MKTLVVGLGNPILGDDGIGWRIAQQLQDAGNLPFDVDVAFLAVGGISLMEALVGYKKAIIIDAIVTHQASVGTISSFKLNEIPDSSYGHLSSAHDTSLQNALQLGRDLGVELPDEVIVVAIESQKVYEFSETLTEPVFSAIPEAVSLIKALLSESDQIIACEKHDNNK